MTGLAAKRILIAASDSGERSASSLCSRSSLQSPHCLHEATLRSSSGSGMMATEVKEKHPPGLYVLFFTEMWERFGFYSMLAMFVKYLTDDKYGGLGWARDKAT